MPDRGETLASTGRRPIITGKKEAIWTACKPKTCCYTSIVVPTGRDVWRIARALDTPAWTFLKYFPSPTPRRDAFILDQSGQMFRLALAKQVTRRKKTLGPCTFLMRTRSGFHRCGLGDLRPLVCKSFPSDLIDGVLCVRNDVGCTCRTWALADVDIAEERTLVEAREEEAAEYREVVAHWNALVASAPPDERFSFIDYCAFIMDAYDEIARAASESGFLSGPREGAYPNPSAEGGEVMVTAPDSPDTRANEATPEASER